MRKEILIKRNRIATEIAHINEAERVCSKEESFKLVALKNELKAKYNFLNQLLKVI